MWDSRFAVTASKDNNVNHPFFRQYFDKQPKTKPAQFQTVFAASGNELPGIVDAADNGKNKNGQFHTLSSKPKQLKKMFTETRFPLPSQSKAFPSPKKHLRLTQNWDTQFHTMVSKGN